MPAPSSDPAPDGPELILNLLQLSCTSVELILFVHDLPEVVRQLVSFQPQTAHLVVKNALASA